MKKPAILTLVGAIVALGVGVVLATTGAVPSLFLTEDERINREYASKVSLYGFVKVGMSYEGNGCCPTPVLHFYGPRDGDIVARLSAPGLEITAGIQPSVQDPVFEQLAVGKFPGPKGRVCSVFSATVASTAGSNAIPPAF